VLKEIALGPFNTLIESLSAAKDEGPYGNGFALAGLIFDVIGVVKSVRKSVRRLAQKTKVGAVPPPHASPRGDEGRDAEAIGTDDLVSANEALNQSGVKQELAKQPKTGKRKSDNGKGSPPHLRVHPRFGKPAAFGHATHVGDGDWRKTYEDAFGPEVAAEVVVHHAVPRQMQRLHPELISPAEEHSLENLRGIPKGANADLHLSKIRRTWNKFGSTHPKPTKQEILDFATQVDDQFGHLFRPPVR
jgi:hypothetical protein